MRRFLLAAALLSFTSCSGGSDENNTLRNFSANFAGVWEVTFNSVLDDCELLEEGLDGFNDQHTVNQTGDALEVSSDLLPLGFYEGALRSEQSFRVDAELEGDLFGTGFNCQLIEGLSYNDFNGVDTADIVYKVQILCDDGSRCDTGMRGLAKRASE